MTDFNNASELTRNASMCPVKYLIILKSSLSLWPIMMSGLQNATKVGEWIDLVNETFGICLPE